MSDGISTARLYDVVREVGAFCLTEFKALHSIVSETKGPADYVSVVDRHAERLARERLEDAFPGIPVLGEEQGGLRVGAFWAVDPVDGTANFLSGLPLWAVSIALMENGQARLGAIALPALGAIMVGGSDYPLEVDGPLPNIEGHRHAFGVGRNPIWPRTDRSSLEEQLEARGYHIVSLGSCAASLAMVASGRLAGYVERAVALWDCAAGQALCRSAGRQSSIVQSRYGHLVDIVATDAKEFAADDARQCRGDDCLTQDYIAADVSSLHLGPDRS